MYIPKKYGQGKLAKCIFCGKQSTLMNDQNIPVCKEHKDAELNDLKCICGEYLDVMNGKYGLYFRCMRCGNINLKKVLEFNEIKDVSKRQTPQHPERKKGEVLEVRSDDPRFFD